MKNLENKLEAHMKNLKSSSDYEPLDFELLLDGIFVAYARFSISFLNNTFSIHFQAGNRSKQSVLAFNDTASVF